MTWPQYKRGLCLVNGVRVRLSERQALVLAIVMMRHDGVTHGELIEAIWPDPDDEPGNPSAGVDRAIYLLRRKIHPHKLIHDRLKGYRID